MSEALARICALAQAIARHRHETGLCTRDDLIEAGFTRAEIDAHLAAARACLSEPPVIAAGAMRPAAHIPSFQPSGAPRRAFPRQMTFAEAAAFQGAHP
ncbi:hypothetical protein V5G24_23240 [Xanthobacter sp. VTT E-85241]|uniref:hypothetical protein n=1 Tax=Roseixanthobacter finlandensis TaxID=3119922 RepID=UPI003727FD85